MTNAAGDSGTMTCIRFSEIERYVPALPGLYEIYKDDGTALKVGIGVNLRKRLIQHRKSRQSRLILRAGGDWNNPADVRSAQSILAKHLYFAGSIDGYDLRAEAGRQAFLEERCYIRFRITSSREEARLLERVLEAGGAFPFQGRVNPER
ncbi:hypothetical protein [Stutzerimonas kunmingensis]|uniref:hypothetical protein n=1 Tax=Stutzerimonas kunmingensis TaxID=1211807 RepID=UPI0028A8D8E2|nr:hypothetical protein [Stutzerimonas kunmingensis]